MTRRTSKAILEDLADFIEGGDDNSGYPRFGVTTGKAFDILAHEILTRAGRKPAPLEHPFIPSFYTDPRL